LFLSFFFLLYLNPYKPVLKKEGPMPFAVKIVCLFCLLIHSYTIAVSSFVEFGRKQPVPVSGGRGFSDFNNGKHQLFFQETSEEI